MQVIALELFQVSIPFREPYKLSKVYGTATQAEAVVVKVHTDTGLFGYGEADPKPPFTEEAPSGTFAVLRDTLGPSIIGLDPRKPNVLHRRMDQLMRGNYTAKGALDMAFYDLQGKAAGLPVHALLGGALRQQIAVLWPTSSGSAEEDAAIIEAKSAEGFSTYMLKMGVNPVADEITRVRQVLERFGSDIHITVDANQGWSASEAMAFVYGVRGLPLAMIEQPVAAHDIEDLTRVRGYATSPVSADESVMSAAEALRLIKMDAVDIFSLKVSKNGGIGPTREIATLAAAAGIDCLMNSMLEFGITQAASLQLGATLPNLVDFGHAYMSTLRMADDFTDFSARVVNGMAHIDDRAGLGVEVDDDKLKHYSCQTARLGEIGSDQS